MLLRGLTWLVLFQLLGTAINHLFVPFLPGPIIGLLLLLFFLAGPEKPLAACLTLTGGGIPLHHLRTHIHSLGVGSLRTLAKVLRG